MRNGAIYEWALLLFKVERGCFLLSAVWAPDLPAVRVLDAPDLGSSSTRARGDPAAAQPRVDRADHSIEHAASGGEAAVVIPKGAAAYRSPGPDRDDVIIVAPTRQHKLIPQRPQFRQGTLKIAERRIAP